MKNPWIRYASLNLLVLMALLIVGSCSRRSPKVDSSVFSAFSDFAFVGEGVYRPSVEPNRELNPAVAEHDLNILPLPERPEIGKQYIFHHKPPLDVEKLALIELPSRLQIAGLQVVKAPHSSREMMYLYFGGPLFNIKFMQGSHVGFIFDQPCPKFKDLVKDGSSPNDFVVVFLQYAA